MEKGRLENRFYVGFRWRDETRITLRLQSVNFSGHVTCIFDWPAGANHFIWGRTAVSTETTQNLKHKQKNIHIMGLSESIESSWPTEFFSVLLSQLLGAEILPMPPVLDRTAPKPKQGERPQPIIAQFHDYQTKERVLSEARKRRSKLQYLG